MKARGHSLIELLFTLALVGLLAALAYPPLTRYVQAARRTQARMVLAQLLNQQEAYYNQHGCYQAFGATQPGEVGLDPSLVAACAPDGAQPGGPPAPSLESPGFATRTGDGGPQAAYRFQAEACPATPVDSATPAPAASAGPTLPLSECVQLRATPVQDDPEVGSLLLRSTGARSCTGARPALCWP